MTSPTQIASNQANAQHSTGPVTDEGKARVSQNAVRHGLTARHLVIRDDEREEFDAFHQSLAEELDPQGPTETIVFNELLHAAWNLHRFRRIEADASLGTVDDFTNPATTAVLDRLTRYQARAQRAWQKSLHELSALQTNRALRAAKLTEEEAAEVPVIASVDDLTKQTQSDVTAEALDLAVKMINLDTTNKLRTYRELEEQERRPARKPSIGEQANPLLR